MASIGVVVVTAVVVCQLGFDSIPTVLLASVIGLGAIATTRPKRTRRTHRAVPSARRPDLVAAFNSGFKSLAGAFVRLGCVRAMEVDIHATNPTLNFFSPKPGSGRGDVTGTKRYPAMTSSADRFLVPDQRDFFAVTVPGPGQR